MTTQPAPTTPPLDKDGDLQVLRTTARPGPDLAEAIAAPPADRHARRAPERILAQLRRIQWTVRAVLLLGVAASVCANVLHARHSVIAQSIAAWPPLALLLTIELISRVPVYRRALAALRILATAGIAGIAAYVSYFHMAAVVSRYGEPQPNPYLLPISVDGLIVVASVSLVELAGRVRALRDTPALVHQPDPPARDRPHANTPSAAETNDRARGNGHVPNAPSAPAVPATVAPAVESPVPAAPTTRPSRQVTAPPPAGTPAGGRGDKPGEDRDGDADPELTALLPAARAARDTLRRAGRGLTRDSLAAQLRRDGHTIRTSRVSTLLNLLRNDAPATVNGRRASPPS